MAWGSGRPEQSRERAGSRWGEWPLILAVAAIGLVVAAVVALTPWHVRDLPGGDRPQPVADVGTGGTPQSPAPPMTVVRDS